MFRTSRLISAIQSRSQKLQDDQLSAFLKSSVPTGPKLHLGCGEIYLEGYVNIDFPPSEHTVMRSVKPDVSADLKEICFPLESVALVRSHHVFEHFDRPTAIALLCRWHLWLKLGGLLVIETPDFSASQQLMVSRKYSYSQKQVVLRHLFGSHEASWAVHRDGWYEEKFRHVLGALGFGHLRFQFSKWQMTRNITVCAQKTKVVEKTLLRQAAHTLLRDSMVDRSPSEEKQWRVWCQLVDELLGAHNLPEPPPAV